MSQKTLRNFQVVGALYSGVGAGAQPAQAGDEIRLFLNQVANPGFPEYIDGLIQLPVSEINMLDSGGHVVPGTSYTFSYESDDLEGAAVALTACDIINASPITCCVALREALDAEIAARVAGVTNFSYPIAGLSGGGATKLDSLVVDSGDLGRAQVVAASGNLGHYLHVLESGTDAEAHPYIIRPDNYDGVTNAFVWKWKPAYTDSASIVDVSAGGLGVADENRVVVFGSDGSLTATTHFDLINADVFAMSLHADDLTAGRRLDAPDASGTLCLFQTVVPTTPTTGNTITGTTYVDQSHYVTPAGTLAALTIALPTAANARAGQMVKVWITQDITALTVNVSGGGTILGAALTAAAYTAGTPLTYECVSTASTGTWIRRQ